MMLTLVLRQYLNVGGLSRICPKAAGGTNKVRYCCGGGGGGG